jgi:protein-arginine kinase activator protein McsA
MEHIQSRVSAGELTQQDLLVEMDLAIASMDFEKAAALRDLIRK